MTDRKYTTEFALHVDAHKIVLLQQDELVSENVSVFDEQHPCHIYMIHRRPRITLSPDSVTFSAAEVTGTFRVQKGGGYEDYPFTTRNSLGTSEVEFLSEYPHNLYEIRDRKTGESISRGKVALLAALAGFAHQSILDLEVLYVGQSYGVEGARTAPARLMQHSTLQKIYAEAVMRSPDQEIWLTLWSFKAPTLLISIDGHAQASPISDPEDDVHIDSITNATVSEQQIINFTEAALIRYFQPPYNYEYKNSFPSPAHITYLQCYDLDLNAVGFQFDTSKLLCRLWSHAAKPRCDHSASFLLNSAADRKDMFDFS